MTAPPLDPWRDVSAARFPAVHVAALGPIRDQIEVRVHSAGDVVWVRWTAQRPDVVRCLLPVPGVEFFSHRNGLWFRFGNRLPADVAVPEGTGSSVAGVLVPARFEPAEPPAAMWSAAELRIVRGGAPKPASALSCATSDLVNWADSATTAELTAVRGVHSGQRVVLLGSHLPSIPAATRYWGGDVLVPIGFRCEPALPPDALREAVGVGEGELLLLDEAGTEVIPRAAFAPLTRAGIRLALREHPAEGL